MKEKDEVQAYKEVYRSYSETNWILFYRCLRKAKRLMPSQKWDGLRILNIGCGAGYEAAWLLEQGAQVTALDVTWDFLSLSFENLRANGSRINFVVGDGVKLPFENDAFDLVLILGTLHHIEEILSVLKECRRVSQAVLILREPRVIPGLRHIMKLINWNTEYCGLETHRFEIKKLISSLKSSEFNQVKAVTDWAFFPDQFMGRLKNTFIVVKGAVTLYGLLNRFCLFFGHSIMAYGQRRKSDSGKYDTV